VAVADLLRVVVQTLVIIALVLAGAGLLPFYAATIPSALAAVLLTGWLVRHDTPLLPALRPRAWSGMLRDTLSFSVATAVIAVYFRVAIIVVSLVTSGTQTGYFAVSFRVIEVLITVPALLVGVAFPIFARAASTDSARLAYAVGRVFDALLIAGLGTGLALLVAAPFIISVIAGPDFRPAEDVLRIQAIALVISFTSAVWGYALLSRHKHREILVASLVALAITIILSGTLGSIDGGRGAATGTAISEAMYMLMLGTAVHRAGIRPAVNWRAVPRVLAAFGTGLAAVALPVPEVIRLVIALALYVVGLLILRAVPRELFDLMRR
jgi:O-antigen/teichoic acid export membrane protein